MNDTFYPTPKSLATKMAAQINENATYILDPSAGNGTLLDAVADRFDINSNSQYRRSSSKKFYAIELDQELITTLRGKEYDVIAFDFLSYHPFNFFDTIIMNPPFDNGDKHLLHALDILKGGEIVCLLNEETISNPYTKTRQLLLHKLKSLNAIITQQGQPFINAHRKTDIRVIMVYVNKTPEVVDGFEYWNEIKKEKKKSNATLIEKGELTQHDKIEAIVSSYNEVQKEIMEGFKHIQRAFYFAKGVISTGYFNNALSDEVHSLQNFNNPRDSFIRASNSFMDQFRKDSWKDIFRRTGASKLMTRKIRNQFEVDVEKGSSIDFTVENIRGVIDELFSNAVTIVQQSLLDVFEHLCKFDKKNKIHIEGWKTNSAYKVNKRVIVPWAIEFYFGIWSIKPCYDGMEVLEDLDKTLCRLDGKDKESIVTIHDAINSKFKTLNEKKEGNFTCTSTFFEIHFYKKGTLHLKWRDMQLWARFNVEAAKGKNWIGDDSKEEAHIYEEKFVKHEVRQIAFKEEE